MKLRRNHGQGRNGGTSFMIRLVIYTLFFIGAILLGFIYLRVGPDTPKDEEYTVPESISGSDRYYLPRGENDVEIIHHRMYTLSYNEKFEVPNWVAYELTKDNIRRPNVSRKDNFREDKKILRRSATIYDYKRSGYTRGHMVPAADFAYDRELMNQTFLMSNITPQLRSFNNGIWRELEEQTRDWAYQNNRIFVVSGTIFDQNPERIGDNLVGVPEYFYKVLIDIDGKHKKGIGFILPHETSDRHLREYAQSIDMVEQVTGIDFFGELIDERLESRIEGNMDIEKWKFDEKRFQNRVTQWNKN